MKAWRRSGTHCPVAVGAVVCGEQPGEQSLTSDGPGNLVVLWDWPFGASALEIDEASSTAPDTWVVAVASVAAADDMAEWVSSFPATTLVRARLRRLGSDAACAVVTDYVEVE